MYNSLREVVSEAQCTVFEFFSALDKILGVGGGEGWLREVASDPNTLQRQVKQMSVNFIFLYMLYTKIKHVSGGHEMCSRLLTIASRSSTSCWIWSREERRSRACVRSCSCAPGACSWS